MQTRRLLLLSKGFSTESIKHGFLSSFSLTPNQVNVAIIPTASAEWKEKHKGAVSAFEYFKSTGFKNIDFIDIEYQSPELLKNYEIIFISGGDPFYLLRHLKYTGTDKVLKKLYEQGVCMVGSSAGAMIFGTNIRAVLLFEPKRDTSGLTDFSSLACIPFAVLPHADQLLQQYENYNEIMETVDKKSGDKILAINDNDGVLFLDDVVQFI